MNNLKVSYVELQTELTINPKIWLITGVAGFIGSNLLETLLKLNQRVIGLDNFSTGYQKNLDDVEALVALDQWKNFQFVQGDIRKLNDCIYACQGVDYVLHHAALGSVPRSILDPITTNMNNIDGFLNMLVAARDSNVKNFVYAASSSTYGDHSDLPKVESKIGKPLSPYAVTKLVNEIYADVFNRSYGFDSIGLRYFNVFGKRQNPSGEYAAVIPKWIMSQIQGREIFINGDGETSRDFCHINNVIQANLLAATTQNTDAVNQIYNIAVGEHTSLNKLLELIRANLKQYVQISEIKLNYREFRNGDVRHSLADIGKASNLLGYKPVFSVKSGLAEAMPWYLDNVGTID